MISRRFDRWTLEPNRLTVLLRARRAAGARVLDLTVSNPTAVGLDYPAPEILSALADRRSLAYEPSPAGLREARKAVADYHGSVDPDRVFLTSSTSEGYAWLFKLLADPGDEILVPRPSYPLFDFLAGMEHVGARSYSLVYHGGWEIDLEVLSRAVTPRTRAVVAVSPNNPTGSFLREREYEAISSLCAERNLSLIADEVFADYAFREDRARAGSLAGRDDVLSFCLSGLSKVVGLPQAKLGWIVIGGPREQRAAAAAKLELIADTYLSVGTPVQWAASRLLALRETVQERILERARANLEVLSTTTKSGTACTLLDVEGGWSAILRFPGVKTGEAWALELLEEDGVLVQPGYLYDFDDEAYVVVSLLTPEEILREGVERIVGRVSA